MIMDTSGSEDHPRATGHPTQTTDAPPPAAPEPAIPPPPPASAAAAAVTGIEYPPSDEEERLTPAQVDANCDTMEGAVKESMEHVERDDDAPVPPVQTAAEYEEMENTIKQSVQQSEDAPLPPSQIAAPTDAERGDDETDAKKKPAPTTNTDDDTPPTPPAAFPPGGQDEAIPTRSPSADPPTSPPPPTDHDQIPSTVGSSQQPIIVRPPPQSMLPVPDEDASTPSDPSASVQFMPQATLVVDPPIYPATRIQDPPEIPISPPVQVGEQTWLKKHQKYIFGALGLFVGLAVAVAVGLSPGSNKDSDNGNANIDPEAIVSLTIHPSKSSSPSDIPSLRPTHQPSQSSAPSTNPSQSAKPSTKPTPLPSSSPSKIPSSSLRPSPLPSRSLAPSSSLRPTTSSRPSQIPSIRPSLRPSPLPSSPPSTYWSSLNWSRQGLGFNGDASDDYFGRAVAFSADAMTMAIGAPGRSGNNDRPGYVKVYGREGEGSSWEQRGDTLRGEANGDLFGHSLSLSEDGTALSIGAPRHVSVGPDSGQVKVYEWDDAALDYSQIGDTLYGTASGDRFGYSLDISNGKILAVGARLSDANGIDSGQVTIYAWDEASLNFKRRGGAIDGDAAYDWFGYSVSLAENGQKLAVAAPRNGSNGDASGQVRVFEWVEATSNYVQLGESLLGNAADDRFGLSVSFSRDGTTLAIGAPGNNEKGVDSGEVKVFAWDEAASNFEQIGQSLYGQAVDGNFGNSAVLSSTGKTLAVGAPYGDPGYVEVYEWDEAASEYERLGQSLGGDDGFGLALAFAGNGRGLAVGAPLSGRVEVFNIEL